jgi:ketosteroid isomerase-like protein
VDVLQALADAFNAHDLDRFMAYVAEDCVLKMPRSRSPFGSRFVGRAVVREGLAGRLSGLPDVHYGDFEHFVCGDTAISKRLLTGTTSAGVRIEVRGCDFYSFRDRKIIKKTRIGRLLRPDQHGAVGSFHFPR